MKSFKLNEVSLKELKAKLTPEELAERERLIKLEKKEMDMEFHEIYTPNYRKIDEAIEE